MKFQVLMATMNRKKEDIAQLIQTTNLACDILLINQCGRVDSYELNVNDHVVNVYEMNEKGLSKSRNAALSRTDADICLIADDDILYDDNLHALIDSTFVKYPEYDMIAFYVERTKNFCKKDMGVKKKINWKSSLEIMSVQIAFRTSSIRENGLAFDSLFGAGSGTYICGEENIFLMDCIRKGLRIIYVPVKIATTRDNESSWFKGYTPLFFESKGAAFQRLLPRGSIALIFAFGILKWPEYNKEISFLHAMKFMFQGRKQMLAHKGI